MRLRVAALALGVLGAACFATVVAAAGTAGPAPATRLRAFDGCGSFVTYMRSHALPIVGLPAPVASVGAQPGASRGKASGSAAQDPTFSGTNVQEGGVDEPDTVKTDGHYLYVAGANRISAIDVRSAKPALAGTLALELGGTQELLLHGDRLLVLSRGVPVAVPGTNNGIRSPVPLPIRSSVSELDVSNPARMRLMRTMELDGSYLTARLVGSTARIVTSSPMLTEFPLVPPDRVGPSVGTGATERNKQIVRSAGAKAWLPRYTVRDAAGKVTRQGGLVGCKDVLRPPSYAGLGLTTVVTVDLARGLAPVDSDAVTADARVVYASPSSLYVATDQIQGLPVRGVPTPGGTTIHQFDISSPTQTVYRASGRVPGVLLDQWSLSERGGILRVASTTVPVWTGGPETRSETVVTTLTSKGGRLVPLGKVGGLGAGDRVYAVRFVDDVGYVVTFKQVDPLYTVDLSVPARPVVRGELELRGYSAYLHPVGDGLLLGIGQDATDEGRVLGVQASLFDVSDLRHPRRIDAFSLGSAASQAEQDHHAFLWWPRTHLAVIPVQTYAGDSFVGALGLRVGRTGITEVGRVAHPGTPAGSITRSLVVGDTLYTVSTAGVKGSSLATFADRGFVRLPSAAADRPPPTPKPPPPPPPRR